MEWDQLLNIVKSITGVRYVPDTQFVPNQDILIDRDKLPRFRSFTIYDLNGNLLLDQGGLINPIYYPNIVNAELNAIAL